MSSKGPRARSSQIVPPIAPPPLKKSGKSPKPPKTPKAPKTPKPPKAPPKPHSPMTIKKIAHDLLVVHTAEWRSHARSKLPAHNHWKANLIQEITNEITGAVVAQNADERKADATFVVEKIYKEGGKEKIDEIYDAEAKTIVTTAIDNTADAIAMEPYTAPLAFASVAVTADVIGKLPGTRRAVGAAGKTTATSKDLEDKVMAIANPLATQELTTRGQKEPDLNKIVTDPFINKVTKNHFTEPLIAATAFRLGAVKRWGRRDKDGKQYRQDLKDAARDKAGEEIHTEVQAKPNLSDTMKEFYEAKAQGKLYKDVKKFVDEVTFAKAETIATALVDPHKGAIKEQARKTLYAGIRGSKSTFEWRMKQIAAGGAVDKIEVLYPNVKQEAITQASDERTDVGKKTQVKQDITDQIDATYTSEFVKAAIESDTIGNGWKVIAGIIDTAVPNIGGKAKLDLQLKIPVQAGIFITFQFVGEAERESYLKKDKSAPLNRHGKHPKKLMELLKARVEFTTGVGGGIQGVFEAAGQFGGFMEAQANTSHQVTQLLSYAMYRKMNDYRGLAPLAARIWGQGGKTRRIDKTTGRATGTNYTRGEEAELWAAMVEEQAMTDKHAYADIGLLGKAKAVGNLGVGKGELEAKLGGGTRYSGYMFGAGTGAGDTKGKNTKSSSQIKAASAGMGLVTADLGGKIEVEGPKLQAELKGKLVAVSDPIAQQMKVLGGELEGEFQVQSISGKDAPVQDLIATVGNMLAIAPNIVSQVRQRTTTAAQKVGAGIRAAEDATLAGDGIAQGFEKSFTDGMSKLPDIQDKVTGQMEDVLGVKSALGINLKFSMYRKKMNPSAPKMEPTIDITVVSTKGLKVDVGVFVGEIEVKQRLGGYSSDGRFAVLGGGTM